MKDTLYVYGSTWQSDFPIWKSTNPTVDDWEIAVDTLKVGAWDPAFHYDEDKNKLYLYWGSSNVWPILGTEINTKTMQSEGYTVPIVRLYPRITSYNVCYTKLLRYGDWRGRPTR